MEAAPTLLALSLVTVALVGCIGAEDTGPTDALPVETPELGHLDVFHDHTDATLHEGSENMTFVSWSTLGIELGTNGFANFVIHKQGDEELAAVAIDGDTDGGFVLADISDPENVEVLGSYIVNGNSFQEVRISPDGRYAILNVQDIPTAQSASDCPVCIHIVDITDRENPERVGLKPVEVLGTHNFHFEEIDGELYVLYVGQPLYLGTAPTAKNEPAGNAIHIARFVETPDGPKIVDVAEYRHQQATTDDQRSFPHDVLAEPHPLTDQVIMYVSHWDGGAITVDITDPMNPVELAVHDDPAPSQARATHWFSPELTPRGDKVYAYSAPEIGQLDSGSGVVRVYDATDPASLEQVGTWTLPGNVTIPGQYLMSPHTTMPHPELPLLAVSHYHAGVWILDTSDPTAPKHVGYYSPVGEPDAPYTGDYWWKKPNFDPEGFIPNVYQARWEPTDGILWVTDRSTGFYALSYDGPVPGAASAS
ncbi:MAG: hypothetical protein R3185_02505 [Candidatus Thermoplasmatota archaeon]|nr:hypothetical protein [Candidatus Thermoplasmatota archaeon]